jgi:hypothetical protein
MGILFGASISAALVSKGLPASPSATSLVGNDYRTPVVPNLRCLAGGVLPLGAPQPRLHPHPPGDGQVAVRPHGGGDTGGDSAVGGVFAVEGLHSNATSAANPCR